jgi:hypothetical protein
MQRAPVNTGEEQRAGQKPSKNNDRASKNNE